MTDEIIDKLEKLQKDFDCLYGNGLIAVNSGYLHVDKDFYKQKFLFGNHEHKYAQSGRYIEVSCIINRVKYLALFEPVFKGELKDMLGLVECDPAPEDGTDA